jgi:hypothetical protein
MMVYTNLHHRGSPSLLVTPSASGGAQGAEPEQVELRPAVHAALQQLEPVDVPFGLSVAPMLTAGRSDGRKILLSLDGELA